MIIAYRYAMTVNPVGVAWYHYFLDISPHGVEC